jgi:ClpP class serine protease
MFVGKPDVLLDAVHHAVLADDSVGGILVDIDSPGGSVKGIAEFSEEVYRGRLRKPIMAVANSLAASAAYWIGRCRE